MASESESFTIGPKRFDLSSPAGLKSGLIRKSSNVKRGPVLDATSTNQEVQGIKSHLRVQKEQIKLVGGKYFRM